MTPTPNQATESDDTFVANGIDGRTGGYLLPPQKPDQVAAAAAREASDKNQTNLLRGVAQAATQSHLGAMFDVDLTDVTQAGWCVVFHEKEDAAVKAALDPLIAHRKKQIGDDTIVQVFDYQDGESAQAWLVRHRMGMGDIDPTRVPFYVLLVGSPECIPFAFGHVLDSVYGVGRLCFDTPSQYGQYVSSVIAYETGTSVPNTKDVVLFGTRHVADKPTRLSAEQLVRPLGGGDPARPGLVDGLAKSRFKLSYRNHYLAPEASTKQALTDVFRPGAGQSSPALLFTASHGLGWPMDDPNQLPAQGALLCQDFPGIAFGPVKPEHYFAASDLPADAHVHGLVTFHFACYGAGTPRDDRFSHQDGVAPPQIAPKPFFAALPQSLLSHPNGSALAVIGHVERAWPNSIVATGAGVQLLAFTNALSYILLGYPLGYALKDFNERYAALSTNLNALLEKKSFGLPVSDSELATNWTSRNDAESYTLMGDPAVRVRKELLS
jgi:hypothetical protein